ncbi:CpaE family protein [Aquihabitans daechungensis]|uniref:AAA family ATPase n=1 Tax=Aquihabitans daechungensis TaxID=1052257 RepID=UPI003BA35544
MSLPGRVVVVLSPKGGAGSTTVAINLASAARQLDRSVILVDGDPLFGDVSLRLGLAPPPFTPHEAIPLDADPDVDSHLVHHPATGIRVIAGRVGFSDLNRQPHRGQIVAVVSELQARADLVIVDLPLRHEAVGILSLADRIFLVTRPDAAAFKNALVTGQLLAHAAVSTDNVGLIINRSAAEPAHSNRDIEAATHLKVAGNVDATVGTLPVAKDLAPYRTIIAPIVA